MGILNLFFKNNQTHEDPLKHWKHYLSTIERKKQIINSNNIQGLKKLLELELVDISGEETEIIQELEKIEHSQKLKRIQKLEDCLACAETKYEYVHGLLHQLHLILQNQIHLVNLPESKERTIHLKRQLELELEILNQIEQRGSAFQDAFLALMKGEHIIKTMDAKEKKLLKKMEKGVTGIFTNEIREGITRDWAFEVLDGVKDKVEEATANGTLDGNNPFRDFEFVNSSKFVDLVRESIQNIKKKKVSEQMITVFVHLFREWFNHRD